MKIKHLVFVIVMAITAITSCTEEEQPPTVSYVFTDVSVDVGQTSATITCRNESVDDDKVHASVLLSKNENITDVTKYSLRLQGDTLRGTINGLEQNTMYFFCFEVYTANEHKRTEEVHHFQTTGNGDVTVITLDAVNVTQTTATGGGSITTDENHTVSLRGVCWDTVPNPNALQSPHLVGGEGMGTFLVNITGLISGTTYYMRAYALCNDVTYYGNQVSFRTSSSQAATVTTGEVTNITRTTALGSGEVTDDGGAEVTQRGVCWSTSHNPTTSDSHASSSTGGTGAFTANMTELTPNTKYYVRAYAKNEKGTSYGEEVSFTTAEDVSSPTVTTSAVTSITQTTAKGHGNVTADGGATVTERGVCWSTSHNPTTSSSHASSGTGTGSYEVNMTNLSPGTTYYVRAYARNSVGTAYSEEVSFTTTANKPTVTTNAVTNIMQTTAKGGGNVTDDGGVTVTERGICWSTSHSPTTSSSHSVALLGGTGSYTLNMTGLTPNTTYYVRAYATNSVGTSYGSEVSFKTSQNVSAPTVSTSQVTDITQTTAKGHGNVTSDGGGSVTERGVCWSTSHNPVVSGSHASSGTGTGSFTVNMTGLTANTTYYVRAYAKNSQGSSYGAEVSFTTSQNVSTPTVTTSQVTNITQTTATGGGNVTSDGGGSVTERGVCWSTSQNPTTSNNHTTDGTGTGSFTSNITGLSPNTTYYVRAYATNSAGTAYGVQRSFTTSQNVNPPTVTTSQITNITQTSATGGGNVTANGGANVTDRGICWSTSHNPTTSGSHASSGTGNGTFSINMTGLTANTIYYVRAYATNSAGTAYGSEVSFTTLQIPSYTISVSANPSNAGTVSGGGNYQQGQSCTVTASANNGYTFTNWTENGSQVSNNANYTFTVNSSRTLVAHFTAQPQAPTGAINGLFSVSATQQVWFSQGNLQYIGSASTPYWKFADNQWDYLGTSQNGGTNDQNKNRDLFGWGTSGYNHGATCYQPWSTSPAASDYYAYGNYQYNLYDQTGQADWGYNVISNGGNDINNWRTLNLGEWGYVFLARVTTSGIRFTKAEVNNVNGVILLPDDWNSDYYSLNSTNLSNASFSSNIITATQWSVLELHGAVFLPAAGCRTVISVSYAGDRGCYWSATHGSEEGVYGVRFDLDLYPQCSESRYKGYSVRLVQDY